MRKSFLAAAVLIGVLGMFQSTILGYGNSSDEKSAGKSAPNLETLLKSALDGVDGTEVIVSRVTIPPNTSLPKHWHPGEEFAYVLEGSVTLWQQGKRNIIGNEGDVIKVPLKQIHTAITGHQGVKLLIFRVHEQGQPERIMVD